MAGRDQTQLETHFAFGDNWADYAALIDAAAIARAEEGILKLVPKAALAGRSFLDVGCGSGLHALAALRLGAGRLLAVDIDPNSVATARGVLQGGAPGAAWEARQRSVLEMTPDADGRFDIVYSWGVLHHTGAMDRAIRCAAALVAPGGMLAFALYRRTALDQLWIAEKRWYARAGKRGQRAARAAYRGLYRLGLLARGRSLAATEAAYRSRRGMSLTHDIHDWLGGYPYEAILAPEVDRLMTGLGFAAERVFARGRGLGLLGSGCDEYVYRCRR